MTIGRNIRRLRRAHGETQEQLGEVLEVSGNAVSQWENDRATPRMGVIERMAMHWRVQKSDILDEVRTVQTLVMVQSPEERDLVLSYRDLDDEGRSKLLDYAHDLISSGRYVRKAGDGTPLQSA